MGKLSRLSKPFAPLYEKGKHWNNGFKFTCEACKLERHLSDLKNFVELKLNPGDTKWHGEDIYSYYYTSVCFACVPKYMKNHPEAKLMK